MWLAMEARGSGSFRRSLLAVFAHPDDEAFAAGGTLARYAAEGAEVRLVCATRGEAGSLGEPPRFEPARLGAVRAQELSTFGH